ncbi:copper ion binding [Euphorbia peplus]|nr:copper ion binding [Euphorbia peplus]
MATRMAARYVSRRFSSGGRVLSEEEKAAENIYIKKMEQEKLEKLARKGPKPEEKATSAASASAADVKPSGSATSAGGASTEKVSTDKNRNYAVIAGTVTIFGALGWYLNSRGKKTEEVQD